MPYVLKHQLTGELFSCTLTNVYNFQYHGVKAWDDHRDASAELGTLTSEQGDGEPWLWQVTAIDESKLKLCNVRLNNDPSRRVFMLPNGRLETRSESS